MIIVISEVFTKYRLPTRKMQMNRNTSAGISYKLIFEKGDAKRFKELVSYCATFK